MSIASVILKNADKYAVRRVKKRADESGYSKEITVSKFTIKASIQPMQANELRNMPEGQNHLDWQNIWSLDEFKNGDKITYLGEELEIQKAQFYKTRRGNHYQGSFVRTVDNG